MPSSSAHCATGRMTCACVGRLVQEGVAHDEQVERRELAVDAARVRRGDGDVRAEDEERADAPLGAERVEQLVGALALAGQRARVDAPDPRHAARSSAFSISR